MIFNVTLFLNLMTDYYLNKKDFKAFVLGNISRIYFITYTLLINSLWRKVLLYILFEILQAI